MGLPRGPGSSRHGRGLVTGTGDNVKNYFKDIGTSLRRETSDLSRKNFSDLLHSSKASKMKGGCAMCGGRRKRKRRYTRLKLVKLKGRGVTRVRSVTVTRPSGASKTRSWGYTRSLGAQQAV